MNNFGIIFKGIKLKSSSQPSVILLANEQLMWQYNLSVHVGGHRRLDEEENLLTVPFESCRVTGYRLVDF
jgi:hypothetical protein